MTKLHFSLDVESLGLHWQGFAFGYVVVDAQGNELEEGYGACENFSWDGVDQSDRAWVEENVIPNLNGYNCFSLVDLRDRFWQAWLKWKKVGALLIADCPFPVETNFISSCIQDNKLERKWSGPYPLVSIDSVLLAAGMNPLAEYEQLPHELPKHNPVADARQSARLFLEAVSGLERMREEVEFCL